MLLLAILSFLLVSCIFPVLLDFVFSFIGIATVVPDPCPDYIKNSDIGKYIFNEPILSYEAGWLSSSFY